MAALAAPVRGRGAVCLLLLFELLGFHLWPAAASLQRLVLVTRHGDRERLVKNGKTGADVLFTGDEPRLVATGTPKLLEVARALRQRYQRPGCIPELCLDGAAGDGVYDVDQVHVHSSSTVRTIGTANAMLSVLFPAGGSAGGNNTVVPVPVFSEPDEEDWHIRAYTKCPMLAVNADVWYNTDVFKAQEAATLALRTRVGAALAGSSVTNAPPADLRDWYNVYDILATRQAAGTNPLNSSDWTTVKQLAGWAEAMRYGTKVASNLCGGSLLAHISALLTSPPSAGNSFYHVSAHYPTMLCLLSSLGVAADSGRPEDSFLASQLLPTASLLAFELSNNLVQLRYWDTVPNNWRDVRLPCFGLSTPGALHVQLEASGTCYGPVPLPDFVGAAQKAALSTVGAWCAACNNNDMPGCPPLGAASISSASSSSSGALGTDQVAGLAVGCGIGGLLLGALVAGLTCRQNRREDRRTFKDHEAGSPHSEDGAKTIGAAL